MTQNSTMRCFFNGQNLDFKLQRNNNINLDKAVAWSSTTINYGL